MISPNSTDSRAARSLKRWLPLAALLILAWAVWRLFRGHSFDFQAFRQTLAGMDPWWITLSVVLILITYAGRALRWLVMIRPIAPNAKFWPTLDNTMIGFCAAVLLGRAGEFVRPYLIAKQENVSVTSQVAIWFLERLTDLLAVLVLFGFALSSIPASMAANVGPQIRWVLESGGKAAAAVGALSLLVLLAFRQFPDLAQSRVVAAAEALPANIRERLLSVVDAFSAGLNSTRDSRALVLILVYSFAEWLLIEACYYSIFKSFQPTAHLTLRDTLIVLGFVSFGSMIQVPGVGGGMQIVAVLVLREMFGVGLEQATAIAMLLWIIGLAIVVPPGLILAARRGLSWRKITVAERPV